MAGRELAVAAGGVETCLEAVEGYLAHHRVQAVLDLPGEESELFLRAGLGQQPLEDQPLAEDGGGLGQGQGRIRQQGPEGRAKALVHGVAKLVGQGQDVPSLAHVVHEDIGMVGRDDRVGIGPGLLAGPRPGVDPGLLEHVPGAVGEPGGEVAEAGLDHLPGRGVPVPMVQCVAPEPLRLEPVIAVRQPRIGLPHGGDERLDHLGLDPVREMA